MKKDNHNPQNMEPEHFGGPEGFRLLTQEEAAVLMDPEGVATTLAVKLRERLAPQLFNTGPCRWEPVLTRGPLCPSFTYRTAAPEYVEPVKPLAVALMEREDFKSRHAAELNRGVALCHGLAVASGWHSDLETGERAPVNVAEKLLLIHSEISEATEGFRKSLPDDKLPHRSMIEVELADAVIRIFDLAGALDMDLGGAIVEKLEFNQSRADHKPENRRAQNGKQF